MTLIEQPSTIESPVGDIIPPQSAIKNIIYREKLRLWAVKDPKNRKWIMQRCKKDFFWWLESFSWLYEPRPEEGRSPILPFIPWPHQRPIMETILNKLGYCDIGIKKARGEGATWLCLNILLWKWLFFDLQAFGLVSRNELTADNPSDPDSLGAKLDWELSKLPQWMTGKRGQDYVRNISKHTWINKINGSTITAYPSTGDLASGGRKTAFFMDELSKFPRGDDENALTSTEPVTNCRLFVSTFFGAEGAYYRAMTEESSIIKLTLSWLDNPDRAKNKFIIDGVNQQLLNPETLKPQLALASDYTTTFFSDYYPILQKRGFCLSESTRHNKKIWSPWYVARCLRARMTPQKIAQEYDMDPIGSGNRFFPVTLVDDLLKETHKPDFVGDLIYNKEILKLTKLCKTSTGSLSVWLPVSHERWRPPAGEYVIGCDVAQGVGTSYASNSAICVVNRQTGEKVAEYANAVTTPEKLAEIAIALAKFFCTPNKKPAFLIWEANGYGGAFRERLMNSAFRNIYYRTAYKTRRKKPTREPGWWSSKDAKVDLFSKYRWALQESYFSNPSEIAIREAGQYAMGPGGRLVFISLCNEDLNPSDEGENHGDRCTADALANMGMEYLGGGAELAANAPQKSKNLVPVEGSAFWRRTQFLKKKKQQLSW